jgi:hypothetical protein
VGEGKAIRIVPTSSAAARPSTPDLTDGSDSGASCDDNVTADTTPTLTGQVEIGATIRIFSDGALVGSGVASNGYYTITTSALAAGAHQITATATGASGGASAATAPLAITIDAAGPTADIIDVSPDPRSTAVNSINISFSEAIADLDLSDFSLTRDGGANLLTGSEALTQVNATTWSLGGLATLTSARGNYLLTLKPSGVHDAAGNALASSATDAWGMLGGGGGGGGRGGRIFDGLYNGGGTGALSGLHPGVGPGQDSHFASSRLIDWAFRNDGVGGETEVLIA